MKLHHNQIKISLLLCATIAIGEEQAIRQQDLKPFPYTVIGNIDQSGFKEPSGICFHPLRESLFVVGDKGHIGEMQTDGTLLKQRRIRKADFEGITSNPSTGLLYVAVEGEEALLEIDPESLDVLRTFEINRSFDGQVLLKAGGGGIEAITFVPDSKHPHGGSFYVANQSKDLSSRDDISAIFELEVPLAAPKNTNEVTIQRVFSIGAIDLAGLHYDWESEHLLVVSDKMNALFAVMLDGVVVSTHELPGIDQEGIALSPDGFMFIAHDSGGILKIQRATLLAEEVQRL